jgi:hypothetical protein
MVIAAEASRSWEKWASTRLRLSYQAGRRFEVEIVDDVDERKRGPHYRYVYGSNGRFIVPNR